MPYPNEHSAQIVDSKKFSKFRRDNDKFGNGIDVIWGIDGDKPVVQAIRFGKEAFSPEQAKAWMKKHDYSPIKFEPASEVDEDAPVINTGTLGGSIDGVPNPDAYKFASKVFGKMMTRYGDKDIKKKKKKKK